ncbi:MAG: RNA-directed DNA polymerase [Bacteroidales bacterium]|nr:RNA-directed DNA polymerase [Bacteroidales bacterium]
MFKDDYQDDETQSRRSIMELSAEEARAFLSKNESYFNADLPEYINFERILKKVGSILNNSGIDNFRSANPNDYEGVNYRLYSNKNGKYDWRPLELIHPALYVALVHAITEESVWASIKSRFSEFSSEPSIQCHSLPVESLVDTIDKAQQVSKWWAEIEQRSIELSMEYDYTYHTDITDCYGSIYTHSIPWALHGREFIKQGDNRDNKELIGNVIDKYLRNMRTGQTNGIPQGSVLMDFIAEMVLGYADLLLFQVLKNEQISDFRILRYRDDYRIFVNNPQIGDKILKALTEILIKLGMKLNASKTFSSDDVITSSLKKDKLAWMCVPQIPNNLQSQLMLIYQHSLSYQNSGSLCRILSQFYQNLGDVSTLRNVNPLISIVTEIALSNPRTLPACVSILSRLINPNDTCMITSELIQRIKLKFSKVPNTGLVDIWLQRLTMPCIKDVSYSEPVCKVVEGHSVQIWNSDWLSKGRLRNAINPTYMVVKKTQKQAKPVIQEHEFSLFLRQVSDYY